MPAVTIANREASPRRDGLILEIAVDVARCRAGCENGKVAGAQIEEGRAAIGSGLAEYAAVVGGVNVGC